MSRDISWINEISNTTDKDYIMWVWDTDNEGEYKDFRTRHLVGRNDGGKRVIIKAGAHLTVTGCGIPDGGDKHNKPKCRVLCEVSKAIGKDGDPGRGFRLNRVMGGHNKDKLSYRNHESGEVFAEFEFHRGMEQNIVLRITNDGIFADVKEQKESTEWKVYEAGKMIGGALADLLKEAAKLALQAAGDALMAA